MFNISVLLNYVYGTNYNDYYLKGSYKNDFMYGWGGNDTFYSSAGNDTFYGGSGVDTVNYTYSYAGINVSLSSNTPYSILSGKGGDAQGDQFHSIENITGSNFADTIVGSNVSNVFVGNGGHDKLYGLGGDDILLGGRGEDRLYGGSDDDYLNGGYGSDRLEGGSGDDDLYGGHQDDTLIGGSGADYLNGGSGIDNADYYGSSSGVNVNLATGTGSGGDAEGDRLISIENVGGTEFDDVIYGDSSDNVLTGYSGDDELYGGGGNDFLISWSGNNEFYGEEGNDLLMGGGENDRFFGGQGSDTVIYSSYSSMEIDLDRGRGSGEYGSQDRYNSVENVVGTMGDDEIIGSSADNILSGGAGSDFIDGGRGDDILSGQAVVLNELISSDMLDFEGTVQTVGVNSTEVFVGDFQLSSESFDIFNFDRGDGHDVILDFQLGRDIVDLRGYGIEDWDDLTDGGSSDGIRSNADGNAVIFNNNGDTITFDGISVEQITAQDFGRNYLFDDGFLF